MANFQTLPGFREFYPEDYAQRRYVFQVWRQAGRRFGFQEFDGPALESLDLFKAKSGDEIEGQLFCFEDKGGREVSLRPELTPSLARMVAAKANAMKLPIKWFSIGDNYRYEKPQKGRLRCFTQFNADILGEKGPAAEIEMIALTIQTLLAFSLTEEDFYIRLSDRELWMLYLEALGFREDVKPAILSVVDKWEKLKEEAIRTELNKVVGERSGELWEAINSFLKIDHLEDLSGAFATLTGAAVIKERLDQRLADWRTLLSGLEAMGFGSFVRMDLGIVRGLAYYTGFVFEAFDAKGEFRAIAGGGRYDDLVKKMGGSDMPAAGFGMGDVVLCELLKARGKMPQFVDKADLYAVIGGDEERQMALADIARLRRAGYIVDYPFKTPGFGKQFKAASASGARLALIYGSEELAKGVVKLRDLNDRNEIEVPRDQLLSGVQRILEE